MNMTRCQLAPVSSQGSELDYTHFPLNLSKRTTEHGGRTAMNVMKRVSDLGHPIPASVLRRIAAV